MARFDVFVNPGSQAVSTPYVLEVQSDLLGDLDTRIVIPLRRVSHFATVKLPPALVPVFVIEGESCFLETPKMAAVPCRVLRQQVASLSNEQARIVAAMDFLFNGY